MAKVNWSETIKRGTIAAKARGEEANITQSRNVINDVAQDLVENNEPWEILEAVMRLGRKKATK